MSFISNAAHQKFLLQCHSIISGYINLNQVDQNEELRKDLVELEALMTTYLEMLSEIPKITCKYYNLHRTIRVEIRKLQVQHGKGNQKKLRSKD